MAASLALIISLLLPVPAFALRKAQTDEQREAKGGLEETLRTTGLEEGVRTETVSEERITAATPPAAFARHHRVLDRSGAEFVVEFASWTVPDLVLRPWADGAPTNRFVWTTRDQLVGGRLVAPREDHLVTAVAMVQRDHSDTLAQHPQVAELVRETDRMMETPLSQNAAHTLAWRWEQQAQQWWEALVPHLRRAPSPVLPAVVAREAALEQARLFSAIARALRAYTPAAGLSTALGTGLEENQAAARAAAQAEALVNGLRKQALAAWSPEVRAQIPAAPPNATGAFSTVLIFEGLETWDLAVIAAQQGRPTAIQAEGSELADRARALFQALSLNIRDWFVGQGTSDVLKQMETRGWISWPQRRLYSRTDALAVLGLRESDLPMDVGSALTRTRDYFNAQQAGLESGA
ncbi:MAG: hypothetical protein A3C53_08295 [Omnitrophica WOR_2 bacterium RIFCSPHIGHO2_02_FULL_68_15]|nr:MAG: hypothetical protein A3C53_08295 [Omnitrophica WOR_2 bacterium RIFCSPHIGHO2_02_FULL_68_15]